MVGMWKKVIAFSPQGTIPFRPHLLNSQYCSASCLPFKNVSIQFHKHIHDNLNTIFLEIAIIFYGVVFIE